VPMIKDFFDRIRSVKSKMMVVFGPSEATVVVWINTSMRLKIESTLLTLGDEVFVQQKGVTLMGEFHGCEIHVCNAMFSGTAPQHRVMVEL